MRDSKLFPRMEAACSGAVTERRPSQGGGAQGVRVRMADRRQMFMQAACLDDLIAEDHRVRLVWRVVERLDLARFYDPIEARSGDPGRPATDPRILVALWLHASIDNVGSARRLGRLCEEHDAYRWLCGGVGMNHHTLSDFRVKHGAALDDLLTQMLTALVAQGLVQIDRISQDGVRVRASAGKSSFRRRETLERLHRQVKGHVERLKRQREDEDDSRSAGARAAQERAARERVERVEKALQLLPELEAIKTHQTGKPSKHRPARVSTTDPEAHRMKLGDGSNAPAYNVQFATDPGSRVIVGVDVVNAGTDHQQSEPLRAQVQSRTGLKVREHLYDGGYVKKECIENASREGVMVYAPLPLNNQGEPCTQGRRDAPGVAAWRERMMTAQGKTVYAKRASTSETVNAEIKTLRGVSSFNVRGLNKVRCVALWAALAYNIIHAGLNLIA